MKKLYVILAICLIFTMVGCGKKEEEVKTQTFNTNENIIKDQEVGELKFTNITLQDVNGEASFKVDVTNDSGKEIKLTTISIIFKYENGSEMAKLSGYIGDVINDGEVKVINSKTDQDLTKAYSVEYIINY